MTWQLDAGGVSAVLVLDWKVTSQLWHEMPLGRHPNNRHKE
jgi:hypothetical protein